MAILFSACVSYSVMHVFVCLLEQYDVTSVFRVLLLSRFEFNDKSYIHAHGTAIGTAIGTKMAPTYANIFMWNIEKYL